MVHPQFSASVPRLDPQKRTNELNNPNSFLFEQKQKILKKTKRRIKKVWDDPGFNLRTQMYKLIRD